MFTILNIVGLSVAFAVAILLGMSAFFELSYDEFHDNEDSIYQIYASWQTPEGVEMRTTKPMPFTPALREEIPGVEKISRHMSENVLLLYKEKELNMDISWVDPDFLNLFSFPIEKGDVNKPINEYNSLIITQEKAKMIFGKTEVVGQTIHLLLHGEKTPFIITAVLKDIPKNSSLDFDIIANFKSNPRYKWLKDRWDHTNHEVFMQLKEGIPASKFESSTRAFANLHFKNEINNTKRDGALADDNGQYVQLKLHPFEDVYFTNFQNRKVTVSRTLPYIIIGIAGLLLFIACINFINMSIAKSNSRLQEIGMRKTLGAAKKHVFIQFWIESVIVFLATLFLGILLSVFLLDDFKTLFNTNATFNNTLSVTSIITIILAFFTITIIAGGYPALLLSKLGTLQALKGKLQINGRDKLRDISVIIQFAIVILLVTGSFVLWGQLQFMRTKDLGFNKEQIISLPLNGKKDSDVVVQLLREELKHRNDIISITASDNNLGRGKDGSLSTSQLGFDYKNRKVGTHMLVVDYDYIETLDIKLLEGRSFSREFIADSMSVIINESMVNELQESDPLGKQLAIFSDDVKHTVIGIVKDYNFKKLDQDIEPITLFMSSQKPARYAYIKIASANVSQSYKVIEDTWKKLEPNAQFLGSFLDENIDRMFRKEKTMITIISSGAIVAIILSCIGLLAISLLVVTNRTKEIVVRKIVGASVASLLVLLAKDFVKLIIIAFVITLPLGWWYSNQWLQEYSYRMELSPWFFVMAGMLALGIALATIGFGTIRAAIQNPIKGLRTE